ncbi:MAG: hypothetical protein RJA61_134 [Candidatus Parcubacteria bacterium]
MRTISQMEAVLATGGISTDERLKRLEVLDLRDVKRKLMEPEPEGKGWTQDQADEAEKWYRRYIATIIKYPNATSHVPNGPIDTFWHQHILDTAAYRDDCAHILGYFLDHYPYFGLNGDAKERDDSFDETNQLYIAMFGEDCRTMSFGKKKAMDCGGDACHGGGTCNPCTVDGKRDIRKNKKTQSAQGVGCNGNTCSHSCTKSSCSKSSCGKSSCGKSSCSKSSCGKDPKVAVAAGCGDKGSGTGCKQGCSRGK